MGEVWIRTLGNGLVRAGKVTEITSTRGSLQEDQGYSLKVIVDGKGHVLIDDAELQGTMAERLEYARHVEDALLLAMDEARLAETSMVISYEPERERWSIAAVAELAGATPGNPVKRPSVINA
jgi:deoxyhypusine synthase